MGDAGIPGGGRRRQPCQGACLATPELGCRWLFMALPGKTGQKVRWKEGCCGSMRYSRTDQADGRVHATKDTLPSGECLDSEATEQV